MKDKKIVVLLSAAFILLFMSIAQAATLNVQTVTNKMNYAPSNVVVVKANAMLGTTRIRSGSVSTARVTIKNPAGTTIINAASMTKDANTGLVFYNYTLPANAPKGNWSVSVTITDTNRNSGTAASTFKVQLPVANHSTLFTTFEGTKTCITCHSTQANAMFGSVHYQWNGDTSRAIELNAVGAKTSKMGGINNFCIFPDISWVTTYNKVDGTKANGACGWCHAGLGLKPTPTVSQQQLENIDCLICHSPTYKRVVTQNADGSFKISPDPTIDIQAAAKNIQRPGRAECMRCHQGAGGGNNYKRGDLESTIVSCDYTYDVHMGTNGQNFKCQDCHKTENHKMAGRGIDLRTLDSTFNLNCESCHTRLPHRSTNVNYSSLNRHSDKVNCTVCHIPTFAKSIKTDMLRNWEHMELDVAKGLYDPAMIFQTNVMPKYGWFNGYSHFYKFKDPVTFDSRGIAKISWPDGDFIDSPNRFSKLMAMKVHEGRQPMESTTKQLIGPKHKIAFETADINTAIQVGAIESGINYKAHTFVSTEQYMGIYHGVGPKNTALSCSNQPCHGTEARIPFKSLGFERRGTTAQLCDVCHSAKSNPGFTSLHSRHRDARNCSACHGTGYPLKEARTTLCDNCHSMRTFTSADSVHSRHVQSRGYDCSNCHTFTANMTGGHQRDH